MTISASSCLHVATLGRAIGRRCGESLTATKLIAARLVLAVIAVAIFPISAVFATAAIVLFVALELVDWADGVVAEYRGHRKPFGGFLDISADQCIETLFWLLFLKYALVPLWIPAVILIRNAFINLLRVDAIALGRDMFGANGMLLSQASRMLVGTRISRGAMVFVKTVGFVAAMLLHIRRSYGSGSLPLVRLSSGALHTSTIAALSTLVAIHLVRGGLIVSEARGSLGEFLWSAPQVSQDHSQIAAPE